MNFNHHGLTVSDTKLLWNKPKLEKPDREPDFVVHQENEQWGPNDRKFWIKERVTEFSDTECESELSFILIDERYGIFADISNRQNLKDWDCCVKQAHSAYTNWIMESNFLESEDGEES